MELVDFYRALLPAHGSYCLWQKSSKRHFWAKNIDVLVAATQRVANSPDWYFGVAAFGSQERRTQANVVGKRCFYLDIDAGAEKYAKHPGEVYPTKRDALGAIVAFSKAASLAPSMIVSSGAGLHVYYALDQDLTEDEWTPMAAALGRLAKSNGLLADAACTTDSARVLRPLGALHGNGSRVEMIKATGKVYSYEELRAKLPAQEEQFALTAPTRAKLDVNGDLPMFESAPASALKVAEHCAALREVAVARGDVQEPLWRAMIGLVKHTVEGEDQAHEWSCGYDGYDERETAEKFNRYEAGPTTCEHFGRFTKACDGCEHRGKITSPIQLGRMTVKQVEALPEDKRPAPAPAPAPPSGSPFAEVDFGEGTRVVETAAGFALEVRKVVETEDADGEKVRSYVWVRISDEVMWLSDWSEAGSAENDGAATWLNLYSNAKKIVRKWAMPTKVLASAQELFKWLGEKGITRANVDPNVTTLMHNYVNRQFAQVRSLSPRMAVRDRFGIQFDSDSESAKLVCAHGRYLIRPDGTIEEAVLGPELLAYRDTLTIKPLPVVADGRWPATVWKELILPGARSHVEFLNRHYTKPGFEVAQLATMLSLASPFLVFAADTQILPGGDLPPGGLTVSLFSTSSGQGKTSMMRVIASAFGDPSSMVRSGARKDATINAQSAFAARMGTMPLYLDEVTQNTPTEVAELVNRISMGSDKDRANRAGNAKMSKHWSLVGTVSSNIPQREMLASEQKSSDALQMRVLELNCEFPIAEGAHVEFERDRDRMIAPYYGCLGAAIHLNIITAGPTVMRQLTQAAFSEAASLIPGSTQRERFFQRGMAAVLACHDALTRMGMAPFDRSSLIRQYVAAVGAATEYVREVRRTPEDLMRKMISDLSPHIIVTSGEGGTRLEPVRNLNQLRSPYKGRRIEGVRRLYLLADAIRDWARENQTSFGEIIRRAKDMGYLSAINRNGEIGSQRLTLTRGTDLSTVHGMAYAFNEEVLFSDVAGTVPDNVVPMAKGA